MRRIAKNPSWLPHEGSLVVLKQAWAHIQSVPYRVGLRWVFYRLLQAGLYGDKAGYVQLKALLSTARKNFYSAGGMRWAYDTLSDETRDIYGHEEGADDREAWLDVLLKNGVRCVLDKWSTQPNYFEVWFEARAMLGQFQFYTRGISLTPFGGDTSIEMKGRLANRISAMAQKYGTTPTIYYFGDADAKGNQIDKSALADIRRICEVSFNFERVGLTVDQAVGMGVPENPDHLGAYQWEALTDAQAGQLIGQVTDRIDKAAWSAVEAEEREVEAEVLEKLQELRE